MRHKFHTLMAALLPCLLAVQLALPAAAADTSIHIRSLEDWESLVRSCTLDTWSQGKTVILDCDLELNGAGSIPTFGGVFDGGGHTIRGLSLTEDGSHQGLFRYVQEGAVIQNLTVSGRVAPTGTWESLGGIAGVNRGTLVGCTFQGTVSGSENVGGIAGVNEATGQIVRCTVSGSVSGEHRTGGIAGENYGGILECTNQARINTQEETASPELDDIDWTELPNTETVLACTDTGGITGYSKGSVQDCVNQGTVGYPHTGYNVGGIAGRQAGYLSGCTNRGTVRGRKEVGGVVGQMEPYTLLRYQEDTLQQLLRQLDVLNGLFQGTLDTTDRSRLLISDQISAITDLTDDARRNVTGMLDQVAGLWDGTMDIANDLSGRVAQVLDQAEEASQSLEQGVSLLSDALAQLRKVLADAGNADDRLSAAVEDVSAAAGDVQQAVTLFRHILGPLREALRTGGDLSGALDSALRQLTQAKELLDRAAQQLRTAISSLSGAGSSLTGALEQAQPALERLNGSTDAIARAVERITEILQEQSDKPALEFPKLDSSFYDQGEQLDGTLGSLKDAMDGLTQAAVHSGDDLSANLRQISQQFTVITDLLRDVGDDTQTDREVVVDISEEQVAAATLGKVEECLNTGTVEGDINVGGVAGAMAIELSLDPEGDAVEEGSSSLNFQYLTRAILLNCISRGAVTARKDCVGGVVGRADLGVVIGCQNYGAVESTGGEYTGGVCGASYSVIRGSWAKCDLTGSCHVGGIAGYGTDLTNCGSLIRILEGTAYLGAIAGETGGAVSGNRFVSDTLGGIDGVSYAGKAEPVTYETLLQMEGIPQDFSSFTLTFTANGKNVATVPFTYGQALSDLPEVPEREGYYGSWEPFDAARLTADDTIEAVYVPWVTTLASEDGTILAEGQFSPNTALRTQAVQEQPPAADLQVFGQWSVSTSDGTPFTALRIAGPEDAQRVTVWRQTDRGTWEKLTSTKAGSYLRVELDADSAVICLTEASWNPMVLIVLAAILAACLLVLLIIRRLGRKRRRLTEGASGQKNS